MFDNMIMSKKWIMPIACFCVCLMYTWFLFSYSMQVPRPCEQFDMGPKTQQIEHRLFENCTHFYLDIGSNIGVQIRKLFEPAHYPESLVLPIFDKYFGNISTRLNNKALCAIGFEMNPHHTQRLKDLETSYNVCGRNVYFYKETAVAAYDGQIKFWSDNDHKNKEWGASTVYKWNYLFPSTVKALNLGVFLKHYVVPFATTIVAKMDIEGQELNVLPSL
jgi:hypothetical protein